MADKLNRMPLSEIAKHLRARSSSSPDDDFDIQQVAIVIKAAEIAAAKSDHSANFGFAAGYIAGMYLGETDAEKAKEIAATL